MEVRCDSTSSCEVVKLEMNKAVPSLVYVIQFVQLPRSLEALWQRKSLV